MNADDEWDQIREDRSASLKDAGSGALRVTLLFGSIAVAFALFMVPLMNRDDGFLFGTRGGLQNLDQISTGSVAATGQYTLRRSVLQNTPHSICVIRANGGKSGDC